MTEELKQIEAINSLISNQKILVKNKEEVEAKLAKLTEFETRLKVVEAQISAPVVPAPVEPAPVEPTPAPVVPATAPVEPQK